MNHSSREFGVFEDLRCLITLLTQFTGVYLVFLPLLTFVAMPIYLVNIWSLLIHLWEPESVPITLGVHLDLTVLTFIEQSSHLERVISQLFLSTGNLFPCLLFALLQRLMANFVTDGTSWKSIEEIEARQLRHSRVLDISAEHDFHFHVSVLIEWAKERWNCSLRRLNHVCFRLLKIFTH